MIAVEAPGWRGDGEDRRGSGGERRERRGAEGAEGSGGSILAGGDPRTGADRDANRDGRDGSTARAMEFPVRGP